MLNAELKEVAEIVTKSKTHGTEMNILLDFDGTLINQNRDKAFLKLVQKELPSLTKRRAELLAGQLAREDRFLCAHEVYDRRYLFRLYAKAFRKKSPKKLCQGFWQTIREVQEPLKDCAVTLQKLRDERHGKTNRRLHRLICATDTDGPDGDKSGRIQASGLAQFFDKIVIGSEKGAPSKGERYFIDFILRKLGAKKEDCVMIGD